MSKKSIVAAVKIMDEAGLSEITTETSVLFGIISRKIHLSKQNICVATAATGSGIISAPAPRMPENPAVSGGMCDAAAPAGSVCSPMVGVVYLAPDPESKPFVTAGGKVAKGDTLCLVEAMKTYNPIKADRDGVVDKILVKDGETVEYGTALMVIK
ncbi:MAG: hypothetical protein LBL46_02430 [Rickettsiales bacterium]|jgi:acetyl-CoA carboxylase biotin carboxyl carrier protein|nr:hypothetical protein [Rickettsiales bacterium]